MKKTWFLLGSCLIWIACAKAPSCPNPPENKARYSDYFVFVANDGGTPLVVPIDVNWEPTEKGYSQELKSWYGTSAPWPINYYTDQVEATPCEVPQSSLEQPNNTLFGFDAANRQISTTIPGAPLLVWNLPSESDWVEPPSPVGPLAFYGFKTTVQVGSMTRTGWAIHERIRAEPGSSFGGADFETFYWLPLVINGDFYLFEEHKGEQLAIRWQDNGGTITADTIHQFNLTVTQTETDATSGRSAIPSQLLIQAPRWNVDILVNSTGNQTGYGPRFPNGLGYYRQSLLEADATSNSQGYGMLEFIVEAD